MEHCPDDAQAWANLGDAYAALRQYNRSVSAYEKAVGLKPTLLHAWNSLGNVLHTQGKHDKAIAAYREATELDPQDASPWVWLCLAYIEQGKPELAHEAVREVQKHLPIVARMLDEEVTRVLDGFKPEIDSQSAVHPSIQSLLVSASRP